MLTWLALGAVAGPLAVAVAEKFFNSYTWQGTYYFWFIEVAKLFMLVSPVLLLMMRWEWSWGASVTDAFLAAFLIGFGYDLIGPLIAAVPLDHLDTALSLLLPGVVSLPSITVAGYGYWCGFAALALAVGLRFGRSRIVGCVTGIAALMAVAADSYFDFASPGQISPGLAQFMKAHSFTPWLIIGALVAAGLWEAKWQAKSDPKSSGLAGFQAVMTALIGLKLREASRLGALIRLRRQADTVQAELRHNPQNKALAAYGSQLTALLGRAENSRPLENSANWGDLTRWLRSRVPQIIVAGAFLLLFVMFRLPSVQETGNSIWNWMVFSKPLVPFQQTLFEMTLVAIMFWYFIIAPPSAFSVRMDEMTQFSAERRLLQAGLAISLVALLYPVMGELFDFSGALSRALGLNLAGGWNGLQLNTLALVLACTACGLSVHRADRWQAAPEQVRTRVAVHNLFTLFRTVTLVWLGFNFFVQLQVFVHTKYGPDFFDKFGVNGNSMAEFVEGLITAAFSFAAAWLLQLVTNQAEKFLKGGQQTPPTARPTTARDTMAGAAR
jgi:hypothetical protein